MSKYEEFLKTTGLCTMENIDKAFKEESWKRIYQYFLTFQNHLAKEMDNMSPLEFELWEYKIKTFLNIQVHTEGIETRR